MAASVAALLLTVVAAAAPRADDGFAGRLVAAARQQIGVTVHYDGAYRRLAYPGGDVPLDRGVCTDVVIRAYRALGIDLQVRLHEDMRQSFDAYPRLWGLRGPDRNIDHRRVPNLARFFARHGAQLPLPADRARASAGELVTFRLASGVPHIGLVSDQQVAGRPLVIHNVGAGTREEDVLLRYEQTGRYGYQPADGVIAPLPASP